MTSRQKRRRLHRSEPRCFADLYVQEDNAFRYSAPYRAAETSQLNDRDIALRRIESRRSLAVKAANARRTPPRNDSVDGWANRNPVSPSVMVSASPPVW